MLTTPRDGNRRRNLCISDETKPNCTQAVQEHTETSTEADPLGMPVSLHTQLRWGYPSKGNPECSGVDSIPGTTS